MKCECGGAIYRDADDLRCRACGQIAPLPWLVMVGSYRTRRHVRDGSNGDTICGQHGLQEASTEEAVTLPLCSSCMTMLARRERAEQMKAQNKHSKAVW